MTYLEMLLAAIRGLAVNRLRTGLTMLGVIIGVASIIAMVSIVEGGKGKMLETIERLGTNLLFISPKELTAEDRRQSSGRSKGLLYEDAAALAAEVPLAANVAPVIRVTATLKWGDRDTSASVQGTWPSYQTVRNWSVERGRFLTPEDVAGWARVAVLGRTVADRLFPGQDPLGQDVKLGAERFVIVGLMEKKGSLHGINFDEMAFIPVTTAMRRFKGTTEVSSILVQVRRRDGMRPAVEAVQAVLRARHDGVPDFEVHSQEDFLKAVDRTIWTFRIVLGGIAAVSLLVGGIGIMNIMLVTVTERTGEIGLRKAVGARRLDILLQFLIESVAISLTGGLIGIGLGILLGIGFGKAVARALPGGADWGAVISPLAAVLAFVFAMGVGVFFGWYPAQKASRLDPAEALRYE